MQPLFLLEMFEQKRYIKRKHIKIQNDVNRWFQIIQGSQYFFSLALVMTVLKAGALNKMGDCILALD